MQGALPCPLSTRIFLVALVNLLENVVLLNLHDTTFADALMPSGHYSSLFVVAVRGMTAERML